MLVPAGFIDGVEEETPLQDLYECKPLARRVRKDTEGEDSEETDEDPVDPPLSSRRRSAGSQPTLHPAEREALCPDLALPIAESLPATLIRYDGDQALIHIPGGEGRSLIPARIDRLTNGAWLSLPDEQDGEQDPVQGPTQ